MAPSEQTQLDVVDEDQARKLLGYKNSATMRNLRYLKKGPPYIKLNGKKIVYPRKDLIAYIEARKVTPKAETAPTLIHGTSRRRPAARR